MFSPDTTRRVLAASGVALATFRSWERDPSAVREISRLRIERALADLGLAGNAAPLMQSSGTAIGSALDVAHTRGAL